MKEIIENFVTMYASSLNYDEAGAYLYRHQISENVKAYFREERGVVYALTLKDVIGMGNRSSRDTYVGFSE